MKRVIILFAAAIIATLGYSQSVTFNFKNGNTVNYNMGEIESIVFDEGATTNDSNERKSLDDYISSHDYNVTLKTNSDGTSNYCINPTINNILKIYVDLEKGNNDPTWCYLWINNSNDSSKFIEISSKYLHSTSTDNFVIWDNNNSNRLAIKKLADNKTYSWLYYNPYNQNEVIIDIEAYWGCLGSIEYWQTDFVTSCVVNIETK